MDLMKQKAEMEADLIKTKAELEASILKQTMQDASEKAQQNCPPAYVD